MSKWWWRHIWPAAVAVAIMFVILTAWDRLGAVIWFASGEVTERSQGVVKMRVTAYKLKNYPVLKGSEQGFVKPFGGPWHPADFSFIGQTETDINRAKVWFEEQSFGEWRWESDDPSEVIQSVMATVIHDRSGVAYDKTKADLCTVLQEESERSREANSEYDNCEALLTHIEGFRVTRIGPLDATTRIVD